jgi:hypothetical protein
MRISMDGRLHYTTPRRLNQRQNEGQTHLRFSSPGAPRAGRGSENT